MREPTKEELIQIGEMVYYHAVELFEECGSLDDFCIQHISEFNCVIFGGFNRMIFRPKKDFHIDPSYCDERFKTEWEKIQSA